MMSLTKHAVLALAASCAFFVAPSQAATVTALATLDVSDIVAGLYGFTGGAQGFGFTSPALDGVVLSEGDTFDLTINFASHQTLTIQDLDSVWAYSYADGSTDATGTGSISLLDQNGAAVLTSVVKTDTEGAVHFGQYFYTADFAAVPSSITFSGVRYVGTVDDYIDPSITSRAYNAPAFFFGGSGFVTSVPEPTSLALVLGGLGVCAAAARRSKQA